MSVQEVWQWFVQLSNGDVISLLQYPALAYLIRERIIGHQQSKAMNTNLLQIHTRLVNVEFNTRVGGTSRHQTPGK